MIRSRGLLLMYALLPVFSASAQNFDTSGNSNLKGSYFLREILIAGQASGEAITSAVSVIGTATFDGKGNYSFTGQTTTSASGMAASLSTTGTYGVAANGFLQIGSVAQPNDVAYGGLSALGPSAFVASATEGTNVDMMVAIPTGTSASKATLKGAYSAGYIDFLSADVTMVRQAMFSATSDGAGNLGNVSVTGEAADLGGGGTTQTAASVTYSLSGTGSGSVNFGTANSSQLISGTKNLYISADQSIFFAGTPNGFDLLVGIKALSGAASNATAAGEYFVAGIEEAAGTLTQSPNALDAFYGSANATGSGISLFHNRLQSFAQPVYDYTFSSQYNVNADGTLTSTDIPYQTTLAATGQAFLATGTGGLYSLVVGLGTKQYSGTGVYLNPLGIVNAGSFAPVTNPIAPNELIVLFGSGLAATPAQSTLLPLPQTLGGVQVTVNGQPAPLFYVTSTQIACLVPSAIQPNSGIYYATIQVNNNGMLSNAVTVYTSNTAPGVFSQGSSGVGPAAAQLADYSLITATNPAIPGGDAIIYLSGLGSVSPSVADGAAAPSTPPLSSTTATPSVDFGGQASVLFSGLTPTLAGLYQIDVGVPSGALSGTTYVDISTPDAYTSMATVDIAGAEGSSAARPAARVAMVKRKPSAGAYPAKRSGLIGRRGSEER